MLRVVMRAAARRRLLILLSLHRLRRSYWDEKHPSNWPGSWNGLWYEKTGPFDEPGVSARKKKAARAERVGKGGATETGLGVRRPLDGVSAQKRAETVGRRSFARERGCGGAFGGDASRAWATLRKSVAYLLDSVLDSVAEHCGLSSVAHVLWPLRASLYWAAQLCAQLCG